MPLLPPDVADDRAGVEASYYGQRMGRVLSNMLGGEGHPLEEVYMLLNGATWAPLRQLPAFGRAGAAATVDGLFSFDVVNNERLGALSLAQLLEFKSGVLCFEVFGKFKFRRESRGYPGRGIAVFDVRPLDSSVSIRMDDGTGEAAAPVVYNPAWHGGLFVSAFFVTHRDDVATELGYDRATAWNWTAKNRKRRKHGKPFFSPACILDTQGQVPLPLYSMMLHEVVALFNLLMPALHKHVGC